MSMCVFFFFKQKTAYEMRISDWSSDVFSSDLGRDVDPFERIVNAVEMRREEIARAGTELIDEEGAARTQDAVRRGGDGRADTGGQRREGQPRQDIIGLFEAMRADEQNGRGHVGTPVTNTQPVSRTRTDKNK